MVSGVREQSLYVELYFSDFFFQRRLDNFQSHLKENAVKVKFEKLLFYHIFSILILSQSFLYDIVRVMTFYTL